MEDLRTTCYVITTIFFVVATATILLRVWVRGVAMRIFDWDDWAMASQLVTFTAQQGMLYYFVYFGGGLHITAFMEKHAAWLPFLMKGLLAEEYLYVYEQFSIKMCFLLFYFRLFRSRISIMALWAVIAWHVATTVVIWLLYSFQCMPLAAFYNAAAYPNTKCLDKYITYFIPYSFNLTTDVLIFLLPIPTIWTLQMSLNRRIGVLAILTTGGSAVLVGGLRALILFEFAQSPDFTYALGKMVIISNIELSVGIIAANMPGLRAFWSCWRQHKLGPGQGVGLSDSSGRPTGAGASGSHELNSRGRSAISKPGLSSDGGRAIRLPSTESEEELFEARKHGVHVQRDFKVTY